MLASLAVLCVAVPTTRGRWVILATAGPGVAVAAFVLADAGIIAVQVAYAAALAGLVGAAGRRAGPAVAVAALAWLAWPVWLAPQVGRAPAWATTLQPGLAANAAVVNELGVWTESATGYGLTPLGQDVAYAFPDSPWPAAAAHAAVGLAGGAVVVARRRRAGTTLTRAAGPG